eukprot:6175835-Pleurochrysis_carterae.AAC.4
MHDPKRRRSDLSTAALGRGGQGGACLVALVYAPLPERARRMAPRCSDALRTRQKPGAGVENLLARHAHFARWGCSSLWLVHV